MAVDGCGVVCKYILIIFNIIFAVVGFVFLGLGLWLRCSQNTRGIFTIGDPDSSTFVIGVTVMIALGIVLLIVVLFGDYGACNEKRCALLMFSVLVFLLAIAEFAVAGLAWSNRMRAGMHLGKFYVSLYERYMMSQDPAIGVILTFIQNWLHCCGITGVSIIEIVKETCPQPSGFMEHIKMDSCPFTIVTVFDSRTPLVMGIFIGTGALLITALVCAGCLMEQIKKAHQQINTYYSTVY